MGQAHSKCCRGVAEILGARAIKVTSSNLMHCRIRYTGFVRRTVISIWGRWCRLWVPPLPGPTRDSSRPGRPAARLRPTLSNYDWRQAVSLTRVLTARMTIALNTDCRLVVQKIQYYKNERYRPHASMRAPQRASAFNWLRYITVGDALAVRSQ